ncbi:MAG TPA: hypothetical protein DEO70_02105 [Bacteroidales bacterium]|nr:MAG: hypothetical protein A2X11_12895 [Bacteroidetes bacterium GWE2_42_24]OFY28936.1 MAG: hypothetical protein A2X09_16985 [Bacteroidetes bacterium GWF2_43_11]HBZ65602.1 hypothetical protein [Bacteroidales bacterium]
MDSNNEFLKALKADYNYQNWQKKIKIPNKVLKRYLPNHSLISDFILEKRRAIPDANHRFIDYFQHKNDKDIRVAISISLFSTIEEAHDGLIHILCNCSAPNIPTGKEKGIDVGDISFCGLHDIQTAIFYTRNNVLIKIESVGRKDYPINRIAEIIDKDIINNIE